MDIGMAVNKLSDKVDKLASDVNKIKVIEERQKNYEGVITELKVEIGGIRNELPTLNSAIAELTNVLSNMSGKAEGAATARKTILTMIWSIVVAGVLALTNIIFTLSSEVAVLKSELLSLKVTK